MSVSSYARDLDVYSPKLWAAIAHVESGCGKYLVGDDGRSVGMFQVQLSTARRMGFAGSKKELKEPLVNFVYAFTLLKNLSDRYNGDIYRSLKAYNAGPKMAKRNVNYKNSKYVKKILAEMKKNKPCLLSL